MEQNKKGFDTQLIRNQKGITLVVLLAVLVILGIIAAIAVPMLSNVIQDSKDKATVNDALTIINAAKLAYTNESKLFMDNSINVNDLIREGYVDVEGFDGVTVKNESNEWFITSNLIMIS